MKLSHCFLLTLITSITSYAQTFERTYFQLDSLYNAGAYQDCLAMEEVTVSLASARSDTTAANAFFYLGSSYLLENNLDKALPYFIKAKDIHEKLLPLYPEGYSIALFNVMDVYLQHGDDQKALNTGKALMDFNRNTFGMKREEFIYPLLSFIDILIEVDQLVLANNELKKALAQSSAGDQYYGLLLGKQGTLLSYQGLYSKANAAFMEGLPHILKTFGENSEEYQLTLANYGSLLISQGKFDQAEQELSEALTAIEKSSWASKDLTYYATLNNLSLVHQSLGQYDAAENAYHEILKSDSAVLGLQHPDYAVTLSNLGLLYTDEKKFVEAERVLLASLEIMRSNNAMNTISYGKKLNNLARVYQHSRQVAKAIPLLEQSLKIYEKELGKKSPEYASSLHNLGVAYLQTGSTKSLPLLMEARDIRAKVFGKHHPLYAETVEKIAQYKWQKKKHKEVQSLYKEVFQNYYGQVDNFFPVLTEEEKANLYFNKLRPSIEAYTTWVIDEQKSDKKLAGDLYSVVLNTKGLILYATDKVRKKITESGDTALIHLFEKWENQKELLAFYYSQNHETKIIDSLLSSSMQLEKELSIKSASFSREIIRPKRTWQEIQKKLKPGESAIEIVRFRKFHADSAFYSNDIQYAALILTSETKEGPEVVLLKTGSDLEGRFLNYYRNGIQFKMDDEYSYKNYWESIHDKLKQLKVKTVYLSPDGAYNVISINSIKNPFTKTFLLEELDIKILTSTRDLVEIRPIQKKGQSYMLYGFPTYAVEAASPIETASQRGSLSRSMRGSLSRFMRGESGIPPLPGTRTEVLEINEIVKGITANVHTESQASERQLKATHSPRVLHIATHGYFIEDEPAKGFRSPNPLLNSGLILAGASNFIQSGLNPIHDGDDGIFTAYEAMNLDLEGTEVVVLSACETGLGHQRNGEGVYGLQRALYLAGAHTVIMSLWSVDDQATRELMSSFYRQWISSGNIQESFKKAQQQLKQKYPHPYYWGAFIMVGE